MLILVLIIMMILIKFKVKDTNKTKIPRGFKIKLKESPKRRPGNSRNFERKRRDILKNLTDSSEIKFLK